MIRRIPKLIPLLTQHSCLSSLQRIITSSSRHFSKSKDPRSPLFGQKPPEMQNTEFMTRDGRPMYDDREQVKPRVDEIEHAQTLSLSGTIIRLSQEITTWESKVGPAKKQKENNLFYALLSRLNQLVAQVEIEDLVLIFKLLRRYNPKVLLEKEEIGKVTNPRYYGKNRPDVLSDRHLEVMRKNRLKNANVVQAFAFFLKQGMQLNIGKGLLGTDRFMQPQNTNKLDKTLEDVTGVFMMLLLNLENRLIFLIHQENHTLTARQALTALVFFATSQEGAQETYIYLCKKIARESKVLGVEELVLFLNYFPHQIIQKAKADRVLNQLAPILYDAALRKIAEEVATLDVTQFLTAFQGIVLVQNRKGAQVPPVLVNSFLTQFFLRLNGGTASKNQSMNFDQQLTFLEIYCKLLYPDGERKVVTRLTQALDSGKLSEMLWTKLFKNKITNCSVHDLAAMLWVFSKLEAQKPVFIACEERLSQMLKEEAAKGILPGTKDEYQDEIESTIEDLETIVLALKEVGALRGEVEQSVEDSISRLKETHGGYHERKKWFYF